MLFFVALEQVFYLFLGSLIYRHGIRVTTISIPGEEAVSIFSDKKARPANLNARASEKRNEVYLKYRYPLGIWGPLLFVGQISMKDPTVLKVRVGIFSGALVLILLISPIFESDFGFYKLLNSVVLMVLIAYFFIRFQKPISQTLRNLR